MITAVKQKRRTLKNRGYALNCRLRRIQGQLQLEADNHLLRGQVRQLTEALYEMRARLEYYEPSGSVQSLPGQSSMGGSHPALLAPNNALNVPLLQSSRQLLQFQPHSSPAALHFDASYADASSGSSEALQSPIDRSPACVKQEHLQFFAGREQQSLQSACPTPCPPPPPRSSSNFYPSQGF